MQWTLTFLVALAIYIYKKLNKKKLITETIEFEFTVDDLKIFDGSENVIFVGIKDKVYNVSTVKQF